MSIFGKKETEGVLLIDKPAKCTSHDVVNIVRRKLNMKQIGHAGTLDPLATGLLIMLVGKATKLSQYLICLNKVYSGTIKLGETTDTYDADGIVMNTKPVENYTSDAIQNLFNSFLGERMQIPPMFSAKKVQGTPLYKMARSGKVIERESHPIKIEKFQLLSLELPFVNFQVDCSKGTYVRGLADEIGQILGCGGHLSQLRRIESGSFSIEKAISIPDFSEMTLAQIESHLIPSKKIFASLNI